MLENVAETVGRKILREWNNNLQQILFDRVHSQFLTEQEFKKPLIVLILADSLGPCQTVLELQVLVQVDSHKQP